MNDATYNPSANFSGFPAGYSPFAAMQQAMQFQQPGTPAQMPQMTPASYGPMHSALAQSFAQALQNQMNFPGLLSQPTAAQMGLLSTAMTPAEAVAMVPHGQSPELGPNQYYRLNSAFWNAMPTRLRGGSGGNNQNQNYTDVRGRNDMMFRGTSNEGYRSNGPYGDAGGGLSDAGQRALSEYGGIF